jgi:hypothetical protein
MVFQPMGGEGRGSKREMLRKFFHVFLQSHVTQRGAGRYFHYQATEAGTTMQ